jgi:hypothetical protein
LTLIQTGIGARGSFVPGSVVQATTVNGVATFRHLAISAPGRYQLRAEVGLLDAVSGFFDIGLDGRMDLTGSCRAPLHGWH